ncbi:MAG: ATP-binding protein, partial [Candidatus Portnoybacteria bacterium]|nr:ATP-binding protein [Candidatus Portnoybacteria bacterium]
MKLFKSLIKSPIVDESSLKQRIIEEFQDFIAPSAVEITTNYLQVNKRFGRTLYISDYPRFLSIGWLSPVINLNDTIDISLFLHPMDSGEILRDLAKRVTRIKAEIAARQEKGLISSPLLTASEKEMEDMREALQEGKERIFRFGCYITLWAETLDTLKELEESLEAILTNTLVVTRAASLIQERGFNATTPTASDQLFLTKLMDTGSLSTSFPFISADLTDDKGILYGINLDNNSLIIFDRFSLENANTVIIGKSGGGKSYAAKLEILRSLMFDTDVFIVDPENEYEYLAQAVDGSYFKISLTSTHHINPFDLRKPEEGETAGQIIQE